MRAKEAVLTVLKPVRKEAIRWVITEKTECTFVGIYTILAFVAILAPFYLITIKTIFTVDNPFWIVDMFWIRSIDTEITIFDMICVVSKFCIFTVFCKEIDTRHTKLKWLELFKKWCIKIKLCPIVYRGPVISPPYFLIIDGIGFIGRVNWDNLVPRLVTFSMIELSLVAKCETSSLAFIWTKCWTWYEVFLTSKNGRDFVVKFHIFISYKKFLPRNSAFFRFDYFFVWWNERHKWD